MSELFAFEQDFVDTLRCVPMAVRRKLDAVAVKLSLRQWSRLEPEDRRRLLEAPCGSPAEAAAYRTLLAELVMRRGGGDLAALADPQQEIWRGRDPPGQVLAFACAHGLAGAIRRGWADLSDLQRFALVKLSRDNHDNVNFVPACVEFGLH